MIRRSLLFRPIVCSLVAAVVMSAGGAFAEKADEPVGRKVLTFYYTWYGSPEGEWESLQPLVVQCCKCTAGLDTNNLLERVARRFGNRTKHRERATLS